MIMSLKANLEETFISFFLKAISSLISKELESSKGCDLRGNCILLPVPNSKSKHFIYFISQSSLD